MKGNIAKIAGKVLVVLFLLILTGFIALQTSGVQSWIVSRVTDSMMESFGGKLSFSSVSFQPFNHVLVKNIVLTDDAPYVYKTNTPVDTVLRADALHASFSLFDLLSGSGIHIGKIRIDNADLNLIQEVDGTINITRVLHSDSDSDIPIDKVSLDRIILQDSRIHLTSYLGDGFRASLGATADLSDILIEFKDDRISAGATIKEMNLTGERGLDLRIKGRILYQDGLVDIEGLSLRDGFSSLNVRSLTALLEKGKDGTITFGPESYLSVDIAGSRLSARSAAVFAEGFEGGETDVELHSLRLEGYMNDMSLKSLSFKELSTGIEGSAKGSLIGYGTKGEILMSLDLEQLLFTTERLDRLYHMWTGEHIDGLGSIVPQQWLTLNGSIGGPLNRLKSKFSVSTGSKGSISASFDLRNLFDKDRIKTAHIEADTYDLDLGRLLREESLNSYTLHTKLDARMSDSATTLFGRVASSEPGLDFDFDFALQTRAAGRDTIRVSADIRNVDLNAYVPSSMPLSCMSMKIRGGCQIYDGKYDGRVDMTNVTFKDTSSTYNAGKLEFTIAGDNKRSIAAVRSDILQADFSGTSDPLDMVRDITCLTLQREIPVMFDGKGRTTCEPNTYNLTATTGDLTRLMPYLLPGWYLSDGTSLGLKVDREGVVEAELSSVGIAAEGYYARDISARLDNRSEKLSLQASVSEIGVNDVFLRNDIMTVEADDNRVSMALTYDNNSSPQSNAELFADAFIYRNAGNDLGVRIELNESEVMASGLKWSFAPSTATIEKDFTQIRGFRASCDEQLISVNGLLSNRMDGQMEVLVQNFRMNTFNPLLPVDYRMEGLADGKVIIMSPTAESFNLMANMHSYDTHIGGHNFGNFNLASVLDPEDNRLAVTFNNTFNGKVTVAARGSYGFKDEDIELDLHADSLSLGCIMPLMSGVLTDAEGFVSGDLYISGPVSAPGFQSEDIKVEDGWIVVDFTKVPYFVSGDLTVDDDGIHFEDDDISDRRGRKGVIYGKVGWDHFNDMYMDAGVRFTDMEVIDIPSGSDDFFNGNAFATGTISFTGPMTNMLCEVNARSSSPGTFSLPLESYEEDTMIDLLSFKEKEEEETDSFLFMARKTKKVHEVNSNLRFRLKLDITSDLIANIEIDKSTGSAIASRGNGNIDISGSTSPEVFDINGDYTLESGDFHFVVLGVANRTFDIKNGSAVHFNGDIDNTDLDINASYITKASISSLIADTTSVATRRNVECGINIGNTLMNPSLSFSINVPDLDPTMKAKVEGALNTDDKIQKQFIALLVTGGFIPDEESGIVLNSSNLLYSNVMGIMAGQLNNILQKFNIPLDLGLSYQANDGGTDIFDVAVSTELFNNRVIVNGSVGNRDNTKRPGASATTSDVVGDVDIEIKLDREGQVRMNMFSHSADEYTNFLDNSQRNGVGITYQKEFNSFREFFRNIFRRKKNKDKEPAKESEQITVTMD